MKNEQLLLIMAERILGEKAANIVTLLLENDELTDEAISRAIKLDINETRRLLHRLFDLNIVKYRRIRDEKIGWYTYLWRITDSSPEAIIALRKKRVLEKLKRRLEYELDGPYYYCGKCNTRYTFGDASSYMFMCPKCDEVLSPYDNSKLVEKLEKIIRQLEETPP